MPRSIRPPPYPEWVLQVPRQPGRVCALGVAGPTRDPRNQPRACLSDAQTHLAQALETRVYAEWKDDGRGLARVTSDMQASASSFISAASWISVRRFGRATRGVYQ